MGSQYMPIVEDHREPKELSGWNHSTLFSKTLRAFVQSVRSGDTEIDSADLNFAVEVAVAMSCRFQDEDDRRIEFNRLVTKYFKNRDTQNKFINVSLQPKDIMKGKKTGGTWVTTISDIEVPLLQVEVKWERGAAGSSELQNSAYYQLLEAFYSPEVLQKTCCPIILMELEGNLLSLSTASSDNRTFQRDAIVSIVLEHSSLDGYNEKFQAGIWRALSNTISDLHGEYSEILNKRKKQVIPPNH